MSRYTHLTLVELEADQAALEVAIEEERRQLAVMAELAEAGLLVPQGGVLIARIEEQQ